MMVLITDSSLIYFALIINPLELKYIKMENIPIKLNSLESEFHYFEDNQVLTANQLNQIVDYFDRQTRLSRTRLTGTGIVCGLDLKEISDSQIVLTKGTGITTDGDLLQLAEDTKYTLYTDFEDTKAVYPSFLTKEDTPQQIKLLRLYPEGFTDPRIVTKPLAGLAAEGLDMEELVLVLYLNSYLEPPEECTEIGCDNKGPRQRQELIALLIKQEDLNNISQKKANPYFGLEEVAIRRVPLTHALNNTDAASAPIDSRSDLSNRFKQAIDASATDLTSALLKICGNEETKDWLFQLIAPAYTGTTPRIGWEEKLGSVFGTSANTLGIQYIHEFMKDLVKAYSEFKACLFELCVECCPETDLFPKHLMVREVAGDATTYLPYNYRHYFCESPALNRADIRVQKAIFLHKRIDSMIATFVIPTTATDVQAIEITPASQRNIPLAECPIPFYYQDASIIGNWSFEKQRRGLANTVLGYHNRTSANAAATATDPFLYCQKAVDFFKIEGHIGLELEAVEEQLAALKKKYNVSFKIENIFIGKQISLIPIRPNFRFPSVQLLLENYRENLTDHIVSVKDYNNRIRTVTFDEGLFEENQVTLSEIKDAKDKADRLNTQLDKVQANMGYIGGTVEKFEASFDNFKTEYQSAINIGHEIKTKVFNAAVTKDKNPLQDFVFQNKAFQFERLLAFKKAKEDKIKEQFIFDNFLANNLGLEHLGGVPAGGTFVLVYTEINDKKRVVADFCLSYCCTFNEDPVVDVKVDNLPIKPPIKVTRPGTLPYPWIQTLDINPIPQFRLELDKVKELKVEFRKQTTQFYDNVINTVVARPQELPTNPGTAFDEVAFKNQFNELLDPRLAENNSLFDKKIAQQNRSIGGLRTEYEKSFSNIDAKVTEIKAENLAEFEGLLASVESAQKEVQVFNIELAKYDKRIGDNKTSINTNAATINSATKKVSILEGKLGPGGNVVGPGGGVVIGPGGNVVGPGGGVVVGPGGNVVGPGGRLSGGQSIAPRKAAKKIDAINSLYLNTLTQSRITITDLAKKKKRSAKEEKNLKTIQKIFKDAAINLLTVIEDLKKDVKASDTTTIILEALKVNKAAVGEAMDTRIIKTKINKLIKKHANKPKLVALLKEL